MNPIRNLIRSATPSAKTDRINALTICRNDEKYISLLANTDHNFYITHPWNNLISQQPQNVYTIGPHSPPIDCLICYDRAEQYMEAQRIARESHLPVILVDLGSRALVRPHNIMENLTANNPDELLRTPNIIVHSSQMIAESWGSSDTGLIIPLAFENIANNTAEKPNQTIVTIDNNVSAQVGQAIANALQNEYSILPTDAEDQEDRAIVSSKYFINTKKNITIKLLEAMFCNNVAICLRSPDTAEFIENKKTGMLIDSIEELPEVIKSLDQNPKTRDSIANAGREYVASLHDLESFVSKWKNVLQLVRSNFYSPSI